MAMFHFRVKNGKRAGYCRDSSGVLAATFAVMLPVIIGAVGMSLDLSQAYLVRERLGGALDAATLAATSSESTEDAIQARVEKFLEANYPESKIGTVHDLTVTFDEVTGDVTAGAYADYDTTFMRVIGIKKLTVYKSTTVTRNVSGVEVALVLDNTGSMSTNDNIGTLRTAATNFVNILFDKAGDHPEGIKIGLVPYANAVRVGKYGLGLNPDDSLYGTGYVFVTLPESVAYTSNHDAGSGWYGCVVEHLDTGYESEATEVAGSKGQIWRTAEGAWNGHGWAPSSTENDPYPDDAVDEWVGPWDIYQSGTFVRNQQCLEYGEQCTRTERQCVESHEECRTRRGRRTCSTVCDRYEDVCTRSRTVCTQYGDSTYSFSVGGTPNTGCPYANVLPLSSDRQTLLNAIGTMRAHGHTLGNIGMAWGQRILSPELPFAEGSDWDSDAWSKAVIVMTDGINTRNNEYSAYWDSDGNALNTDDYNARFLETCNNLKAKGVTIYTITFSSGAELPKDLYRSCATSADYYFDAPTQDRLIEVFSTIGGQLATLHISQ